MTDWDKYALILGALMLVLAVVIAVMKAMRARAGDEGERKRVSRLLQGYAKPRGFKVIDHAVLVSSGISGWADHIMVGHFGVMLVYDLCWSGSYFGKVEEDKWVLSMQDKGRFKIDNPLRSARPQCEGRVITLLKEAGIKVSIESVVVMTGNKKTTINNVKSGDVMLIGDFRKHLGKVKYEQDKDVDVDAVTAILTKALKQGE